jgi:regulator of PEP synthase PpsR (kinase-PPPase family)
MTNDIQTAFFVSDGTGITAKELGKSLLSQFDDIRFRIYEMPYIDTPKKAHDLASQINIFSQQDNKPPIVFLTIINPEIRQIVTGSDGFSIDVFSVFLPSLEELLKTKSSYGVGKSHGIASFSENETYQRRIRALDFTMYSDDGAQTKRYEEADIILVGVSRSGKTPTCLYLAMQFGIKAANYPLTEEDLDGHKLPRIIRPYTEKLFGLTIDVDHLVSIRNSRRANSRYASRRQCEIEVSEVEELFKRERIPFIDTTRLSIEEIATRIVSEAGLKGGP